MKRALPLLLLIFQIFISTSNEKAYAQNSTIVTPANNAVVPTSGFTVEVAPNPNAIQRIIYIINQTTNTQYSSSGTRYGTGTITYTVPPGLPPNTPLTIRVSTWTSVGVLNSSVNVTTGNTPSPSPAPVIVAPANGAVVSTAGFAVQVAANQYATQTDITVREQATGALYASSQSYYTTGIINYTVRPGLKTNTAYVISVTTRSVYGNYTSSVIVTTDSTPAPSPIPVILAPENLSYILAPSGFTVQVAANPYATQVFIRVTNLTTGGTYSSNLQKTTGSITYNVPVGLAVNTRYQVIVSAYTEFGVYSSTTTVSTYLQPSFLTAVEGQSLETTPVPVRYANEFTYPLTAQAVPNSNQYVWELSLDNTFGTIAYTSTTTTPQLQLTATTGGLISGQKYFARVRGIRSATGAVSETSPAREFYNALHPMVHVDPLSDLSQRRFGLSTSDIVANSDEWIFQMAVADNDNDPGNDFAPEKIFSHPVAWGGNSTHPGVVGTVFKANRIKPNLPWGYQAAYSYIQAQPQTTYRVRVRAARKNPNGGYHQLGYWSNVSTFSTNAVPDRVHPIINIPDGAINVENRESQQNTRISVQGMALLWDITAYQLQVSESPDFTTNVITTPEDVIALNNTSGVTEGNPVFFVRNLKFNTLYYARARSLATVKGVRNVSSGWGPVTRFTTKPNPAGRVASQGQGAQSHSFEANSQVSPNPFTDAVRLQLGAAYENAQVRVVNNLGQEVSNFSAAGSQEVVLGKGWPKGLYLIQIYHENGLRETIRVVKQ